MEVGRKSELTEQQWRRMEENRAAALAKRQKRSCETFLHLEGHRPLVPGGSEELEIQHPPSTSGRQGPAEERTFQQLNVPNSVGYSTGSYLSSRARAGDPTGVQKSESGGADGHRLEIVLELCSVQNFSVTAACVGGIRCLEGGCVIELGKKLSSLQLPLNCQSSGQMFVFHVQNYDAVANLLKKMPNVCVKHIPLCTRMALKSFFRQDRKSNGVPAAGDFVVNEVVEKQLGLLPEKLKQSLLPFQWDGIRYGLRRNGRCLIADEMGVGKTIQAIAIAACYREEGSLLVICPASLRLMWAEELERWLPFLAPTDIHLVFGRRDELEEHVQLPKVVVTSYTMLKRLASSFQSCKWGIVIVDESHNLRTCKQKNECDETTAVCNIVKGTRRAVLLSGTPSLSRPFDIFNQVDCIRPGLLGRNKYEFARNYCDLQQTFPKDYSKGTRLSELNLLLRGTIMVRRLKAEVLSELPAKRRQIISLRLRKDDIAEARKSLASLHDNTSPHEDKSCQCGLGEKGRCDCEDEEQQDEKLQEEDNEEDHNSARRLNHQEIGLAKLNGVRDWLLNNPIFLSCETDMPSPDVEVKDMKMVIFGHHRAVLDAIQETVILRKVGFVRVDGTTPAHDRQMAVNLFQDKPEIKVALISVTAGGVGLNFSAAQTVVFAELPNSASLMLQAEDRTHRQGQQNAVNVYIFCAKGTGDDTHWQSLSRSLERVSTMTNGTTAAVLGLEVASVTDGLTLRVEDSGDCSSPEPSETDNCTPGAAGARCGPEEVVNKASMQTSAHDVSNRCTSPENCLSGLANQHANEGKHTPERAVDSLGDIPPVTSHQVVSEQQNEHTAFGVDFLMFEVSSHTGRIHLYQSFPDHSSPPKLLEENFKPEMLERLRTRGAVGRGTLPHCIEQSRAFQEAAATFITQWTSLRPVHRKQLSGIPLQLPLSRELKRVQANSSFAPGGLSKGGSKRRVTPRELVSCPAPEGASVRKIALQNAFGAKESDILQAWSADGEPLCKLCQTPCRRSNSNMPQVFADLFCERKCYESYCAKTSGRYLRQELFELERGVCVECGIDCHTLVRCLASLAVSKRAAFILEKAPHFHKHKKLLENLVTNPTEGNAWHADHIVPVFEGGGECGVENLRTLCIACHAKVTSDQACRRRLAESRARQNLQLTIAEILRRSQKARKTGASLKRTDLDDSDDDVFAVEASGRACPQKLSAARPSDDDEDDDKLFAIEVAGSAYAENSATDRQASSIAEQNPQVEDKPGRPSTSGLEEDILIKDTPATGSLQGLTPADTKPQIGAGWKLRRHSNGGQAKPLSSRICASSPGDPLLEAYFNRASRKQVYTTEMSQPCEAS